MADLELNSIGNGDGNNYLLRDNTKIPLSGSSQISGDLVPATDNSYNLGSATNNYNTVYTRNINHGLSSGSLILSGGNGASNGSNLVLYGKDRTDGFQGNFLLTVDDGTNSYVLKGHQSGVLHWSGNVIRPNTDNACDLGSSTYNFKNVYAYKLILKNSYIVRTANNDYLGLCGGTDYSSGAYFTLYGKDSTINAGAFRLRANDGTNSKDLIGTPSGTLSWAGSLFQTANLNLKDTVPTISLFNNSASSATTRIIDTGSATYGSLELHVWNGSIFRKYDFQPSTFFSENQSNLGSGSQLWGQIYSTNSAISTSDERQKDNIKQIDDKLLQAWGNVNIVQFNFKDALEKKGENARLHTGYIAQNIQQACEENGVNPNDYGLFCHDSWEEQEEKKDENGQVIEPYRAKGDLYSLRYEEALVVECAYLRRENAKLKEQLQNHEDYLKLVEEHLHLKNL